ncbi:MAG: DUF285 domain-containing protein [Paludibacteraceae bacterium]|nr:DUF285 domain-containing protein [Paludibacteraceae bacterium]
MGYKYHPKTKEELNEAIKAEVKLQGDGANLKCIDTSAITDMSLLFYNNTKFNGDISKWDVSNVDNMAYMFMCSQFNGDISKWNVKKVTDMFSMFRSSQFNGNISNWNVSKVVNMASMFMGSQFNGDISNWDVSRVRYMRDMFLNSKFDGDISNWNIDNVTDDRSSLLEFGVYKGDYSSDEESKETGLTYSDKGESSLVCYGEDSKSGKREEEENTIFDKLKNAFGKIFG